MPSRSENLRARPSSGRARITVVIGWLHALALSIVEHVIHPPGITADTLIIHPRLSSLVEPDLNGRLKGLQIPTKTLCLLHGMVGKAVDFLQSQAAIAKMTRHEPTALSPQITSKIMMLTHKEFLSLARGSPRCKHCCRSCSSGLEAMRSTCSGRMNSGPPKAAAPTKIAAAFSAIKVIARTASLVAPKAMIPWFCRSTSLGGRPSSCMCCCTPSRMALARGSPGSV